MNSPGTAPVRGTVLGLLVAAATVAGHAAGGGEAVSPAVLVVLLAPLCAALSLAAARCRSLPALLVLLGSAQLGLHLLLRAVEPAHAGHAHGLAEQGMPWAMLAAHAVVTLLTAVCVRRADAGIAAARATFRRLVPQPLVLQPTDGPVPVVADRTGRARRQDAHAGAATRRGPPVRD